MGLFSKKKKETEKPKIEYSRAYFDVVGMKYHGIEDLLGKNELYFMSKRDIIEFYGEDGMVAKYECYAESKMVIEEEGRYAGGVKVYVNDDGEDRLIGWISKKQTEDAWYVIARDPKCTVFIEAGNRKRVTYDGEIIVNETDRIECTLTAEFIDDDNSDKL